MSRPPVVIIRRKLLAWFHRHRRDLPWRHTRDPYAIAISEIMLQQTQVDRVIPKYRAWLQTFPTVKRLERASLTRILQMWSGLGYNSRGLRLRQMARDVRQKHGGRFPKDIRELEALPGVGPYTARAIASFAFRQNEAVIDTNVRRVISRIFFGVRGPRKKADLEKIVADILPDGRSHDWNATLMDFGALVCQSRQPKCETCPVRQYCRAYPDVLTQDRTVSKKSVRFNTTDRYWRGRTVATLLKYGPQTTPQLLRHLKNLGAISERRMNAIVMALTNHKIVRRSGSVIRIQA